MALISLQGNPDYAKVLLDIADDHAILGLLATDPTTPSTQAAGTGATAWNIDVTSGDVVVGAVNKNYAKQTNYAVNASTCLLADGQSVYAYLVAYNYLGTVGMTVVKGTPATTGSEAIPTVAALTAALTAAVGAGATYRVLALLHLTRSGTTLTQTQVNQVRTLTKRSTAP